MSLTSQLDSYLRVRRSLGYNLGTTERILRRFTRFADREGAVHIGAALFLRWHATLAEGGLSTRAARLGAVRLFAQWLSSFDPEHQAPPRGLVQGSFNRSRPHIYTDAEIGSIIAAATALPSIYGLRGLTCSTLFGLIAVTGLRINEALALDRDDLDCDHGILRVRQGKLGKERLLPLDPSVITKLIDYLAERDRLIGHPVKPLFATDKATRLSDCSARYNFARACQQIGLRNHQPYCKHGRGPRIHDLRHSFAVKTLIGWYRTGKDPAREMIRLTTYLGHSNPSNTYWYLEAVPELLDLAMTRASDNGREAVR
ncbi:MULTISPECIES: tyrosine-type recombinase/integrase [Brucella]|uniref:Tyrosine-type recombinase/integrase n=1 Tax=Brucella pituitosa TaxID=571256 RepID=A0A643EUD5_9HYPH|nr:MULTISPECIES: tyrosine-type recombinase/integrase [Brucella]KAB0567250.1 tyrosine-type recombinase/integrase [Brucella pituitosa]